MKGAIRHNFIDKRCIYCNKTIEQLFYELLESGNPDIEAYSFNVACGASYSDATAASIIKKNSRCLSDDEHDIKDIIE